MRVLVHFVQVPFLNIFLCWTGQFKQVDGLCSVVNDHNIWTLDCDADFRRYGAAGWSFVALKVTVNCVLRCVNTRHNVIQDSIMSPLPATSVQANAADVEHMVGGLPAPAELAEVGWRLLPALQVSGGGQGVDSGVDEELHGAGLEVEDIALP